MAEDSFVTSSQRERIQSFREERADHEDTFEARAHMLDSSDIVDTMQEMLDKSEESLAQTRTGEAAAQAHALLNQDRENTVKGMNEELTEPTRSSRPRRRRCSRRRRRAVR